MKNKRSIMAILIAVLVVVGVTVAYFTTSSSFDNEFDVATYKTTSTEVFESPDNWAPGQEIPKTVTTTNNGSVPVAVRVSYIETWKDSEGNALAPQPTGKVTINLDNLSDWTEHDGYYYYNYPLEPNETTSSFMKSVTFNGDAITGDSTVCTTSADGKSKTCEIVNPIMGATYVLTITIETSQYDAYKDIWNTDVVIQKPSAISYVKRQTEGEIKVGDVVRIGDTEEFYVVSTDSNKTALLAKYNLLVGNVFNYDSYTIEKELSPSDSGYGLQNSTAVGFNSGAEQMIGVLAFSDTNYWEGKVGEGLDYEGSYSSYSQLPNVYDENSNLYTYVENYKAVLESKGLDVIDARLLTNSEFDELKYSDSSCTYRPLWIGNTTYWLGTAMGDFYVFEISQDGFSGRGSFNEESSAGVRPVIELSTDDVANAVNALDYESGYEPPYDKECLNGGGTTY